MLCIRHNKELEDVINPSHEWMCKTIKDMLQPSLCVSGAQMVFQMHQAVKMCLIVYGWEEL